MKFSRFAHFKHFWTIYKISALSEKQGWAMGLESHGICVPGLGTGIGTDSPGTLGTGTNIAGTVPGQKSLGQPNPKLWDHLGL